MDISLEELKSRIESRDNPLKLEELKSIYGGNKIKIYRVGELGMTSEKQGISFYGLSEDGIRSYYKEPSDPLQQHEWTLDEDRTSKIVDLHDDKSIQEIKAYCKKNECGDLIKIFEGEDHELKDGNALFIKE